jgi:hypothetical protein
MPYQKYQGPPIVCTIFILSFKFRVKNLQTNFHRRQFPDPQFQMRKGAKSELVRFLSLKKLKNIEKKKF